MPKKVTTHLGTEPEEQLLAAKAVDSAFLCLKKGVPVFTDFYEPKSAAAVARGVSSVKGVSLIKNGGIDCCERTVICIYSEQNPPNDIVFPIKTLFIDSSKFVKNLNHRDFLGALVGLGIDRGKIGDIFVSEGNAAVFVREEIAGFIIAELTGVGRAKVKVSLLKDENFPFEKDGKIIKVTVPSLRLDAVLAEAFRLSRAKAQDAVRAEKVYVNWALANSVSSMLKEGDTVSARGLGRAVLRGVCGESKKGRIIVELERF